MTFKQAFRGDYDDKLAYLMQEWAKINKKYFKGKLKEPRMRWRKDYGINTSARGTYSPGYNVFSWTKYLFNAGEEKVIEVLKHEIAHQAANLISGKPREHHGPYWAKWCVHMGIQARRLDDLSNLGYMDDKGKAKIEAIKKKREVEKKEKEKEEKKVEAKRLPFWNMKDSTPAQYYSTEKKKWIKGLIVSKNDQAGKRMIFIEQPYSFRWMMIPTEWFYELPEKEKKEFLSKYYLDAAQEIRDQQNKKKAASSERKAFRRMARSFWR